MALVILAISLSMDAFSLSLAYGTLNLTRKEILTLSSVVGIYHLIMPLIGLYSGTLIMKLISIDQYLLAFIVLFFIGLSMIIEAFSKKEIKKKIKFSEYLLFGLAVSIDSFSVGISLKAITQSYNLAPILFSIMSFVFTYLGLKLGKRTYNWLGKISTLLGGILLILLGLAYVI